MPEEEKGGLLRGRVIVSIGFHDLLFVSFGPFAQFVEPVETVDEVLILIAIRFVAGLEQQGIIRNLHGVAYRFPKRAQGALLDIFELSPFITIDPADRLEREQRKCIEHIIVTNAPGFLINTVQVIHASNGLKRARTGRRVAHELLDQHGGVDITLRRCGLVGQLRCGDKEGGDGRDAICAEEGELQGFLKRERELELSDKLLDAIGILIGH